MQMAGSYIPQHLHARVHKARTAAAPRLGGGGTPRSVSKDLSEIAQSLQTRQKEQGSRERVQTFCSTDQCLQNHSAPELSARWALQPLQAKRDIIWQGNTRGHRSAVHRLLACGHLFNTSQRKRSTSPKFSPLPLTQSQAYSTVCVNSQQGFATSTPKLPASELDPHLTHTAPAEGELCDLPLQFKSPLLIPPDHKWFSSLVSAIAFGAAAMIQASVCPFAPPQKGDSAAAGRTRLTPGKLSTRPCSANAPHHAHCWHRSLHHRFTGHQTSAYLKISGEGCK